MAWEDVNTQAVDIKKHKGEAYVGTLNGHHKIETKIGPQFIWDFTGEDGLGFGVYGFTNLNRAFEAISAGRVVRMTYQGTENVQTKYGMMDVHQVAVQIFREDAKEQEKGKDGLPF